MKKVITTKQGAVISFRASGNAGGGGPDDKSPGKGGVVYTIDNNGVIVPNDHLQMIVERLGSNVRVVDASEKDVAPKEEIPEEPKEETPEESTE